MAETAQTAPHDSHDDSHDDSSYDSHYDVVVVGSGFGGSVAALRLSEKGYRVLVLEAGRRFTRETLPKTSWALRDYLWAPSLGLYGIQRIHVLGKVMVLAGAGVGGGSLNYANTLYVPPPAFFRDPQWGSITDWQAELRPFYQQAQRMLGVRLNPTVTEADEYMRATAEKMGVGRSFQLTPVGVFFGDGQDADGTAKAAPGDEVPDPYFGGVGPSRRACLECGECMTGCRHGAKNTLNENYLYLAEKSGARVRAMTTVVGIEETSAGRRPGSEGEGKREAGTLGGKETEGLPGKFVVSIVPTDRRRRGEPGVIRCDQVILAAGTYGTQTLLHRIRGRGGLPRMSAQLGSLTRTNSESLVGALTFPRTYRKGRAKGAKADFTRGVAITSSIHPNESTHIENVRYGRGSNSMALMCVPQYRANGPLPKPVAAFVAYVRHPVLVARTMATRHWSERTIIGLVMQTHDNSLITYLRGRRPGKGLLTARQGHGQPNPVHIPEGAEAARLLSEQINGVAGTNLGELLGMPLTAHFLGGCPISADPEHGVIDPYHRVHGYPGISVVDGSAVSANLGVNPSLTITAQAERAMALWPNRGEPDPRPDQGAPYRRIAPIAPNVPAVPATAFGRLDVG